LSADVSPPATVGGPVPSGLFSPRGDLAALLTTKLGAVDSIAFLDVAAVEFSACSGPDAAASRSMQAGFAGQRRVPLASGILGMPGCSTALK
jgi:hypothetical protein